MRKHEYFSNMLLPIDKAIEIKKEKILDTKKKAASRLANALALFRQAFKNVRER